MSKNDVGKKRFLNLSISKKRPVAWRKGTPKHPERSGELENFGGNLARRIGPGRRTGTGEILDKRRMGLYSTGLENFFMIA